jgi:hypothetical protein
MSFFTPFEFVLGSLAFCSPLCNALIEFSADASLLTEELRLLQGDGYLIQSHAHDKTLGLMRKIRSLTTCYDEAQATSQLQWEYRNLPIPHVSSYGRRVIRCSFLQPLMQSLANLILSIANSTGLSGSEQLYRLSVRRDSSPSIEKIKLKQCEKSIEESFQDSSRLAVIPNSGKSEDADQITHAALQAFDFVCGLHGVLAHPRPLLRVRDPSRAPFAVFAQKLRRRPEEGILVEGTTDDDHRMRTHNVNYSVTAELRQMIGTDHRIITLVPHVIHTGFKLDDIFKTRPM